MRRLAALVLGLMILLTLSNAFSASYTLPEKMEKQLAIGSGLRGVFSFTADGEIAKQPFFMALTDAEYEIRGISAGSDFHYYIYQSADGETKTGLSELYRKDEVYYLRSDMVQGKVLRLPTLEDCIDALIPPRGENPSLISMLFKTVLLSGNDEQAAFSEATMKYEKELELWLAGYMGEAAVISQESGSSIVELSYRIPMQAVKEKIIDLLTEVVNDEELMSLLSGSMNGDQKSLYFNENLIYFYREALNATVNDEEVVIRRQVSTLGEVYLSYIELPLDLKNTGYQKLIISSRNQHTTYELSGEKETIILILPEDSDPASAEYQRSYWYMKLPADPESAEPTDVLAVRIDIGKTSEESTDEEKSHEIHHYLIHAEKDTAYIPEGYPADAVYDFEAVDIKADLHYSSANSQNAATFLEIDAEWKQENSSVTLKGKVKTAKPWVFMPFDISDSQAVTMEDSSVLTAYAEDWLSNAFSMIHHSVTETDQGADQEAQSEQASGTETQNESGPSD